MNLLFPALLTLVLPMSAQALPERFRDNRTAWEESLERGFGTPVRKATEALLQSEGGAVNPSDYNAMHAMVAVTNLAARACVVEGAWEDALTHLRKAVETATDNETAASATFDRIVKQHQAKLQEWREETAKQEQRLQGLESQGGLTTEQIKLKAQIRSFLDEYRNAISQSEKSLREINGLLALLKKEREIYSASLTEWQGFVAKEQGDIARTGSPAAYVAEKLEQVQADDARPRVERLAYGRRLQRLDPGNPEVSRFITGLQGKEVQAQAQMPLPRPQPKKAAKARKGKR